MPFRADKPLICHSEKRYTRAKSRFLSRKPCASACIRLLSRHGLLGNFSVKLIFILNFLKEPYGPWMPCNHFCIHQKCQKTGTSAKVTNLIEWWMIRPEGTWSNDQFPRLVRLALLRSPNFGIAFSFRKNTMWKFKLRTIIMSLMLGFSRSKKKKRSFWIQKWNFEGQWFSSDSHNGTYY